MTLEQKISQNIHFLKQITEINYENLLKNNIFNFNSTNYMYLIRFLNFYICMYCICFSIFWGERKGGCLND